LRRQNASLASKSNVFGRLSEEQKLHVQKNVIRVWPANVPGAKGEGAADIPMLHPILPAEPGPIRRAAMIVCPGGAYEFRAPSNCEPGSTSRQIRLGETCDTDLEENR